MLARGYFLLKLDLVELLSLINSLAPGKFEQNFRHVIFKQILVIDGGGICCEIALIWMSLDFTDDQSTLVQVMAWCQQATSHYLSQCWPRSLTPSGITRPQWVKAWTKWSAFFWQHSQMYFLECKISYFEWNFGGPLSNSSVNIGSCIK